MLYLIYTTTHLFKNGTHLHPIVEINLGPKSKIGPTWSNLIDCTWSNDWHWTRSNVPHGTGILLASLLPGKDSIVVIWLRRSFNSKVASESKKWLIVQRSIIISLILVHTQLDETNFPNFAWLRTGDNILNQNKPT